MSHFSRRDVLGRALGGALSAAALGTLGACSRREEDPAPNVLLLMASGWRGRDLGFLAGTGVLTPNLDRLAYEGVHAPNAFANTPVAASARASLLTGAYALDHRVLGNNLPMGVGMPTFARSLTTRGWRSSYIGTWRLAGYPESKYVPPGPARQGFDEFWAQTMQPFVHDSSVLLTDDPPPLRYDEYSPTTLTNVAIDRLGRHVASGTSDPFLVTVSFGPPHPPFGEVPAKFLDMYDDVALPPSFEENEAVRRGDREGTTARLKEYYAACSAIDAEVGRMLEELDRLNLARNTIVIFLGDHGGMIGEHGLSWAQQPFEESLRVPLIVRWPRRMRSRSTSEVLFSTVDFAPTLLTMCDVPVPSTMRGRDLSFSLHGRVGMEPESVYCQEVLGIGALNAHRTFSWRALRTEQYLYAEDLGGPWLLYDVQRDPYQMHNLVAVSEHRSTAKEFAVQLKRTYARLGESYQTPLEHLADLGLEDHTRSVLKAQLSGARDMPASRVLRTYLQEGTTWTNPRYSAHQAAHQAAREGTSTGAR